MTTTIAQVTPLDRPLLSAEWLAAYDLVATDPAYTGWHYLADGLARCLRHAMRLNAMPAPVLPPRTGKPVLPLSAALDTAQAEKFMVDLPDLIAAASPATLAYLIGQAEGHLQNVVDIVRTETVPS